MPDQKVSLIRGANKGIGFEIARQLGGQGTFTLIGSRDETRGLAAASALGAQVSRPLHCVLT
jgi:NAD(P)-dependent dehydrogenase (short-subunit alcohol dehydrogenase family)